MSSQILLSGGDKWFSYSGEIFGDVSAPATISMINIDNTGLRDSLTLVQPYFSKPTTTSNNEGLGIQIKLDNVVIYNSQVGITPQTPTLTMNPIQVFLPRNSKLEVISINTSGNNTQIRGCNVLGYYL